MLPHWRLSAEPPQRFLAHGKIFRQKALKIVNGSADGQVMKKYCVVFSYILTIVTPAYSAGNSEQTIGAFIGLHAPVYGKLTTSVSEKGEPALPTSIIMTGLSGAFVNRGFTVGGRVAVADTDTRKGTTGSTFNTSVMGTFVGYTLNLGVFDLSITQLMGLGSRQFCSATTTNPYCVKISYLAAEPQAQCGLTLSGQFKVSVGYSYQLGFVNQASQLGTEVHSEPRKLSLGGTTMYLLFSFGNTNFK